MTRSFHLPLRLILLTDAAACLAMGAGLVLAAAPLAAILDLPKALLLYAGLALLPIGLFIAATAWRAEIEPLEVRVVVAGNVLWVLASLAVLLLGPNALGIGFVAAQAAAVAALAWVEHAALQAQQRRHAAV